VTTLSASDAPAQRWMEAARQRRSRRSFDGSPVPESDLDVLAEAADRLRPFPGVRSVLARRAPERLYKGVVGGYGRISGAPSALLFVGKPHVPGVEVGIGYTGEMFVLEATALGLGTCWVGGLFNSRVARETAGTADDDKVYAVTPLGTPNQQVTSVERLVYGMRRPKSRKPVEEITSGLAGPQWPSWARPGLEAVRIAPSAYNRQPWRFRAEGTAVVVGFDGLDTPVIPKRWDCGIAMLHFELAIRAAGATGSWRLLDHRSDVARFTLG